MRAGHQEAIITDTRDAATVLGPGVDRHALADLAARANGEPRRPAAIMYRLRRRAERGERVDHCAGTDCRMARDMHMGDELAGIPDRDIRADDAIGTDFDIGPDDRGWR